MTSGYRLNISAEMADCSKSSAFSGGTSQCLCPNCKRLMFPAFNIDTSIKEIEELRLWSQSRLIVYFCPACFLYMKPYFVDFSSKPLVFGGNRDGGKICQNIDTPYTSRRIFFRKLDESDNPFNGDILYSYKNRAKEEGVYHQIGGYPFKGQDIRMNCPKCSCLLKFSGILDYDDLNVPLYENNGSPVALIIGDSASMNFYICDDCSIIGFHLVK